MTPVHPDPMTVLDRVAEWFSIAVALALLAALQLGLVGPRWELFCDDEPCGIASGATTTFDLPAHKDGDMHEFEIRFTRGRQFMRLVTRYAWDGSGASNIGWSNIVLSASQEHSSAGIISPYTAIVLYGGVKPRLRELIGTAALRSIAPM